MNVLKRNVRPLILSLLLVASLLTLFIPRPSAQIECKGSCELAFESCLRDALNSKISLNP